MPCTITNNTTSFNQKKSIMLKPELYQRTVDILVKAYFEDTLRHGDCSACAVGNLVNYGKPKETWEWASVFYTGGMGQELFPCNYIGKAKDEIDSTGYTWQELAKIEYAFETAPKGISNDEWMFNGLMAVIDVLDQIHENTDTQVTATTKQRFQKTHA